jgi:hypothetical protein
MAAVSLNSGGLVRFGCFVTHSGCGRARPSYHDDGQILVPDFLDVNANFLRDTWCFIQRRL